MSDIASQIQGMSKAFDDYLGQQQDVAAYAAKRQADVQAQSAEGEAGLGRAERLQTFEQKQKGVMTPEMGRTMFSQISPEFGNAAFNYLSQAKQAQGRDTTIDEAKSGLDQVFEAIYKKQGMQSAAKEKEEQYQDKLEKQAEDRLSKIVSFRSGGLGMSDQKVDQARQLRVLLNQYYDPKTGEYTVPPSQHSELAIGMARLLSGTGQVAADIENQIRQKTSREGLASALIYAGMDPATVGGPTQSVIKMFKDSIDRQGLEAETQRDHYMEGLKDLFPSRLSKDRADRIKKVNISSSYRELLKQSPDYMAKLDHPIGRVPVINPKGMKVTIPAEQLDAALKIGYKQVTQ